jgi:hypothetical protein
MGSWSREEWYEGDWVRRDALLPIGKESLSYRMVYVEVAYGSDGDWAEVLNVCDT